MAKSLSASYKEWFKRLDNIRDNLETLHLTNAIGQPVACPTGDTNTCPQCQTLRQLRADRQAAIAYLETKGVNTATVKLQPDPASEINLNGHSEPITEYEGEMAEAGGRSKK